MKTDANARFWQWFEKQGPRIRDTVFSKDEEARERAFAELREATDTVAENLVLEFGSGPEGGPSQLVVSADGRPERVDTVKDFVASAPPLEGWQVIAFRPRDINDSMEIVIGDERMSPDDIWFEVDESDDGLDLILRVRGLTKKNERMRGLGASLLAEHVMGERDALTLLSSLKVKPLDKEQDTSGLHRLNELPTILDSAREKRYPAPGLLPIDPESDWQLMQGTIGDAVAFIRLHAGLRRVVGHPDYDRRLTVSVLFNETRDDGMPATREELDAVSDVGERIAAVLREGQQSLLALIITSQGKRELVFYTSDPDAALARLEAQRGREPGHQIEAEVERDSFWGKYRTFYQAGSEPDEDE